MEDIIALLAREAGKKLTEAQRQAALDAVRRAAAQNAAGGGRAQPGRTTARPMAAIAQAMQAPVAPKPAPVAPAPAPTPPPPASQPADDAFGSPAFSFPGVPTEPAHPSVALLAAFSGGTSLLAGIILSEALAPPVSLRGAQLFERLER